MEGRRRCESGGVCQPVTNCPRWLIISRKSLTGEAIDLLPGEEPRGRSKVKRRNAASAFLSALEKHCRPLTLAEGGAPPVLRLGGFCLTRFTKKPFNLRIFGFLGGAAACYFLTASFVFAPWCNVTVEQELLQPFTDVITAKLCRC